MAQEVVELEWRSCLMEKEYARFEANAKGAGLPKTPLVYAFEGKYIAYPNGAVLYIGETERSGERPLDSAAGKKGQRFYPHYPPRCGRTRTMFKCYSDMLLRWAEPPRELKHKRPTEVLERILIQAMKPALNSKNVDAWFHPTPETTLYKNCRFLTAKDPGTCDPAQCMGCTGLCRRDFVVHNKGDRGLLLPEISCDEFAVNAHWLDDGETDASPPNSPPAQRSHRESRDPTGTP